MEEDFIDLNDLIEEQIKIKLYQIQITNNTFIFKHIGETNEKAPEVIIKEHFGSTVRDKKVSQKDVFTLPNVTNDIFLCQLALIANINQKTFYKLVEAVRENYPEILVYFQANGNGDFYKTPNLDYEADLHIKSQE